MSQNELLSISPVDGRYASRTKELEPLVSEYGLIRNRVAVEVEWLRTLSSGILPDVPALGENAQDRLISLASEFSIEDAEQVKEIEIKTNHDVKSVEMWLRDKLSEDSEFEDYLGLIHFGCTSEDINNLSYAMMLRDARELVLMPAIDNVGKALETKAHDYAEIPLMARTHGQPATPTTLGKEVSVYVDRLSKSARELGSTAIRGKFNGATGNHSAVAIAYPNVDWRKVTREFVESFGIEYSERTTQIESHDWMAAYFHRLAEVNSVLIDLDIDMWLYISNKILKQTVIKDEVGSSVMPQKVNPIDYENSRSNLRKANADLLHLAEVLPVSFLQRDLCDSSTQRNIGAAFATNLVGLKSLKRGLGKVTPNEEYMASELMDDWSILTEAVQTVMRRHRVPNAYEIIKEQTRGQQLDEATYKSLVAGLDIPDDARQTLLDLTPLNYLGFAKETAKTVKYSSV